MKKIIKQSSFFIFFLAFLVLPFLVFADNNNSSLLQNLTSVGTGSGFAAADSTTLASIVGMVVSSVLGLLGVIFICLTVYAGFLWMTASGNDEQVKKATTILRNAIIGLIVTVSVFAIFRLVYPILSLGLK